MCTSAWLSGNRPGCLETGRSPNKKGAHPTKKSTEQCHSTVEKVIVSRNFCYI